MEFSIGDTVEVIMPENSSYRSDWDGLVGEVEAFIYNKLYRVRFPDRVPREPHEDLYILQLRPDRLRLVSREPDWEV